MQLGKRLFFWVLWIFAGCFLIFVGENSYAKDISSILKHNEKVLSIAQWSVEDEELICVVTEATPKSKTEDSLPTRTLSIYRVSDNSFTRIFKYETPDSLLNLYPLGEYNARLMTTWIGGSAYHILGYVYKNEKIEQVLETGSKGMPEIIIDKEGSESVLITHMVQKGRDWERGPGTVTDIYKWTGKTYEKKSVPWEKRFQ